MEEYVQMVEVGHPNNHNPLRENMLVNKAHMRHDDKGAFMEDELQG